MLPLLAALALLADEPPRPAVAPLPAIPPVPAAFWRTSPSINDMTRAFPEAARDAGTGGRVMLDCSIAADGRMTECRVARESPEGQGFGEAALGLAPMFQLSPYNRDSSRFAGRRARVPLVWLAGDCPALFPDQQETDAPPETLPVQSWSMSAPVIERPSWVRRPSGADIGRFYPDRAARLEMEGKTVMVCEVTVHGTLTGCRIDSETPEGEDFGAASLKLARLFKMRPMTGRCESVAGAKVRIPVTWSPPQ